MRRAAATVLPALVLAAAARAQEPAPAGRLRLEDLERLALASNPTIAQAAAAVRALEGRKRQAGLNPNPVLGYEGSELTIYKDKFTRQTEHVFFLEQRIVTARKLKRSRQVLDHAQAEAEAEAEAQKQRVLSAVRSLYYDVLAADRLVELKGDLAKLAREAVGISGELFNIGQADQPDVLQSETEAERAELELREAEQQRKAAWQVLGAVVGKPELEPAPLAGDLEKDLPVLEEQAVLSRLLERSPEVKAAAARTRRALAGVDRERSRRIGDVVVHGGVGFNYDRAHGTGGWIGEAEIRFPLPLFDRQQGALASARAEADRMQLEARRLELALRARLAEAFRRYSTARERAERLSGAIIPRAEQAHRLYLDRFRQMAAAYPQVLIAQRTLFQARAEYVAAIAAIWHEAALIEGFLLSGGLDEPSAREDGARGGANEEHGT